MVEGRVSIIIPMYNAELFLRQTIDSCLIQKYKDTEIVLIDDCSTDHTYLIANEYQKNNSNIKLLKNNTNLGLIKTINTAIDNITGEYVLVLGNDDILKETHLEEMVVALNQDSKNSFAYCGSIFIDESGCEFGMSNTIDITNQMYKIAYINPVNSCGLLMKTQRLIEVKKYPVIDECPNYGEWLLWINLLKNGKGVYVKNIKSLYRIHSHNLTKTFMDKDKIKKNYNYNLICMHTAQKELSLNIYERIYAFGMELLYKLKMFYHIYFNR